MAGSMMSWGSRLFAGALIAAALGATARADDPKTILKAMADYVASQKTLSLSFDADIEVITPQIQKIQFTASGELDLSRPDKVRARRTGGYADVELVADGKALTLFARNAGLFAQVSTEGMVEPLIDRLRSEYGLEMPGADLLRADAYEVLMEDVIEAEHIGRGVVDGIECEHLAFRNNETDWQIWIEVGAKPIPRKYVITSKGVAAAPQYTLRIKDWRPDVQFAAEAFVFQPPASVRKVEIADLGHLDEIPLGQIAGGKK